MEAQFIALTPIRDGVRDWGYAPGGVVGLILVVLLVLLLLGRI